MAGGFWKNDAIVADEQQQPQQQGGGIFVSDEGAIDEGRRAETQTGISVQSNERAERGQEFTQAQALRDKFDALPEVKSYREAATALDTGLFTKDDGSGDGTLLYQYSKLMDPMGSVREGDVQLAQSGAGWLNAKAAQIKKDFNIGSGGSLDKKTRDGLRREMISRFNSLNRAYNQRRQQYAGLAEQYGYAPGNVIGEHAGTPFLERFRAYDRVHGIGESANRPDDTGPVVLPRAAGSHSQGGTDVEGVAPKGEGYRPEPRLYHLGDDVATMIAEGRDIGEIHQYLDDQYAPFGVGTSAPMIAKINEVIKAHKADPRAPIKSLVPGWDNLHMVPESSGATLVGRIADSPVGAFTLGVADIGTAGFGDEIAGAIGGDELNAAWDYSQQERPGAYMAGQIAGGLMLPTGAPGAARSAGISALRSGEGMAAARVAAARTGAQRAGLEAAGYGAVHGAGAADGDLSDRAAGALTEGALGYAGGRIGGEVAGRIASRGRAARTVEAGVSGDAADYLAAAKRQEITPFTGDVDPRIAAATGKLAQTQAGVGPVTRAAQRTVESAKAARDRIAKSIGSPAEGEGLGYRIAEGARKAIARERERAQSLYRSAERQSEAVRVRPAEAFQVVSDEIDKIADTGLGDKTLNIFRRLQDRMTQGPMSVETLRNIRTQIREDLATEGLRGGKANAAAQRVMDAITNDVDNTLRSNGLADAADLFQQADGAWSAYTELTDDVVAPLIGKEGQFSGDQVVKRLQADLRGNNARAAHLLRALPSEEQSMVRASVINSLGKATVGQQGSEGDTFSLVKFLTHWNEIGEGAKEAYFGPQARASLNDLAKVAEGAKQSQRWANHSNSGGAFNAPVEVYSAISTLGTSILATNVTARMLTSPRLVKWLVAAEKKPNPKALEAHVKRLAGLADAEPALANEILNLQQRLTDSLARSPVPVHADEKSDRGGKPPAQGERGNAQ